MRSPEAAGKEFALFCPIPEPRLLQKRLASGRYKFTSLGLEVKCGGPCQDYWPADSEFFYPGAGYVGGLHCYCKACYIQLRYPNGRGVQLQEAA